MNKLHNQDEYDGKLKPEGGLQSSLCSNNVPSCSSPLGFTNFISEDDALDYLAEVLIDAFLDHKKGYANERTKKKLQQRRWNSFLRF
jgi:hypothetical protein